MSDGISERCNNVNRNLTVESLYDRDIDSYQERIKVTHISNHTFPRHADYTQLGSYVKPDSSVTLWQRLCGRNVTSLILIKDDLAEAALWPIAAGMRHH